MNTFLKNGWIQKLIIAIVIVLLFNFIYPHYVHADFIDSVLLDPIVGLVALIGDGFMWITQWFLFDTTEVIINTNETASWWESAITKVVGAVAFVAVGIMTGGVGWALMAAAGAAMLANSIAVEILPENFELPIFYFSPLEIFANSIPLLDANFFNPTKYQESSQVSGAGNITQQESTAQMLQGVVSNVYQSLRNFALVALLIILIYVAIRIIISSTGQDKAKYKNMLFNWTVAICLLFILHYIMVFTMSITEKISEILIANNALYAVEMPEVETDNEIVNQHQNNGKLTWMTTYAGKARIEMQLGEVRELTGINIRLNKVGWVLIYVLLTFYTAYFFVVYLKRVIYLAFLTMIAPLICMMYPIDKIKDGQSQTFSMWLKEYVFNVLLQPLHLLIYTILIGAAGNLATENIIYSVVAIGFLIPAEKFFRKMFGFDKASTTGDAGSFAAGALASQALGNLKSLAAPKKDKEKNKDGDGSGSGGNNIRTQDNPELGSGESDNLQDNVRTDDNDDYWGEPNNSSNGEDRDEAMEKYKNEGYGQNSKGHYYNPWTDEYDENYDPHNDEAYAGKKNEEQLPEPSESNEMPNQPQETTEQRAVRDELNDKWKKEEEKKNKPTLGERYDNTRFGKSGAGKFLKGSGKLALKAGKGVAKFRKTKAGKYLGKKFKGLPKKALRMYAGAVLAGTAGLVGLAAGIADGKPGTAGKYMVAGATAGYIGGKGYVDRTAQGITKGRKEMKQLSDEVNQEKYGTTDKDEIKQIKSQEKAEKKFRKENQSRFDTLYGAQNSERYMKKAIEMQNQGMAEQQIYQAIDRRYDTYQYLNNMSSSERASKYGKEDIEALEDDYMQYMDSGVTNRDIIDKAMQVEHTGVDYDGVDGRTHKGISRDEGMAAAIENQKIEDRYNQETAEREEKIARGETVGRERTKKEIGDAYMKDKRSKNIEKARENGMDKDTAEAFANRSEAPTEKLRNML